MKDEIWIIATGILALGFGAINIILRFQALAAGSIFLGAFLILTGIFLLDVNEYTIVNRKPEGKQE